MLSPSLNKDFTYLLTYLQVPIDDLMVDCLICFFTSHQQSFNYKGTGLPGLNQYLARINVLAQGHNTVTPVRLKPAALRSRVKHSTTEPVTMSE